LYIQLFYGSITSMYQLFCVHDQALYNCIDDILQVQEMELLWDYALWGRELEGMGLFNFILTTHKGKHGRWDSLVFVPYLLSSHKHNKGQLVHARRDEVVPEIFGGWPPALQDTDANSLYEASMLLLFNPWRNLKHLKNSHDSFSKAFVAFENVMADKVRSHIDHIQLWLEWSARRDRGYRLFN